MKVFLFNEFLKGNLKCIFKCDSEQQVRKRNLEEEFESKIEETFFVIGKYEREVWKNTVEGNWGRYEKETWEQALKCTICKQISQKKKMIFFAFQNLKIKYELWENWMLKLIW